MGEPRVPGVGRAAGCCNYRLSRAGESREPGELGETV